jgi:hypothetical protein
MARRYLVGLTEAQRGALRSLADVNIDSGEGGAALRGALEALDNGVWFNDTDRHALLQAQARLEVEWGEIGDDSRESATSWRQFEHASDLVFQITRAKEK